MLITSSKMPDAQAGAEKATGSLAMKLAGAGCHMAAGTLGGVDIYSPLQLVIDDQIVRMSTRPRRRSSFPKMTSCST